MSRFVGIALLMSYCEYMPMYWDEIKSIQAYFREQRKHYLPSEPPVLWPRAIDSIKPSFLVQNKNCPIRAPTDAGDNFSTTTF